MPGSGGYVPSVNGFAGGQSVVPCVSGTYVGKVFANIDGIYGAEFDAGVSPPVTITC